MSNPHLKCGKCGASATHLTYEVDPFDKMPEIKCLKCGNRWPGGLKPVFVQSQEVDMRGTCLNCGRPNMSLNNGLCGTCIAAATKLIGEARMKALAEVKSRIQNGGLKRKPAGRLVEKEDKTIPQTIPSNNPEKSDISQNTMEKPLTFSVPDEIRIKVDVYLHIGN